MSVKYYLAVAVEPLKINEHGSVTEMFKYEVQSIEIAWDDIKNLLDSLVTKHLVSPFLYNFMVVEINDVTKEMAEQVMPTVHLGGTIETLAQLKERNSLKDEQLIFNLETLGKDKVVRSNTMAHYTFILNEKDTVIDWRPDLVTAKILPQVSLELLRQQYK